MDPQENTKKHVGIAERFAAKYDVAARVFRAPGRVNLIGEHTDYNDGFALPAAIDLYTWTAAAVRNDGKLRVYSENLNVGAEIDLQTLDRTPRNEWSDYVNGVALMLQRQGITLRGGDILIHSDVPSGSGLSSSAALEVSIASALLEVSDQFLNPIDVALLCQKAENEFVGARCGILDQFAACFGRKGHAIFLDCRSLDYQALPLPEAVSMVICNTMVKHEHSGGDYNERRAQCEEGVQRLRRWLPKIQALRDVSFDELQAHKQELPEVIYRRCRHVITENARVLEVVAALKNGDLPAVGRCMATSHASLKTDYEVSCRELDVMVEAAQSQNGVIGSRMTGGGFGGCTINLVRTENVEEFRSAVAKEYKRATGIEPEIYASSAGAGAGEIKVSSQER